MADKPRIGITAREVCIYALGELLKDTKGHARTVQLYGKLGRVCGLREQEVFELTELLGDHYRQIGKLITRWRNKLQRIAG